MTSKNTLLLSLLVLVFYISHAPVLQAQQASYSCDFEDTTENKAWKLNVGWQAHMCKNQWFISTAGANEGTNGLYISDHINGETINYTNSAQTITSYRELTLDPGTYTLSFDWQALGADRDAMYVCWVPIGVSTNSAPNSSLPTYLVDSVLYFGESSALHLQSWNVALDTIVSDGTPHKLVFAWNNGVIKAYPPSACIDNIFIEPVNDCKIPSMLDVTTGDTVWFSWKGNADSYDVRCRSTSSDSCVYFYDISTNSVSIPGLKEGICYFYVRANCGDKFSPWVSASKFIFYPNRRCVDYMSLTDKNCYHGTFDNREEHNEVVDSGYFSRGSRHTLHYEKDERDPRTATGSKSLRTVPLGELASVRLGNWNAGAMAESVEYKYTVDASTSAVLLLKYAVVLENPKGHLDIQQANFSLNIYDVNGVSLGEHGCGDAHFAAGFGDTKDWNLVTSEEKEEVLWKDWTTIGINLGDYNGETLTIRLSTADCSQTGHFGYAYFTLGCIDGKLEGLSCGDNPTTSFIAPEGFDYEWYKAYDTPDSVLSTKQEYKVEPDDTVTYKCNVIQPTNSDCHFTITANATPRFPVSDGKYEKIKEACSNELSFTSSGYIILVNQVTHDTIVSEQPIESVLWDFGGGVTSTELSPTHTFPTEGGTFYVKLSSGIVDDLCADDTIFEIVLPDLSIKESFDTIHACQGESFEWGGETYYGSTAIRDTVLNLLTQCDSIININLIFADNSDSTYADTVCIDEPYDFNGRDLTESGIYKDTIPNSNKCDSIITLNLLVNKSLKIDFPKDITLCADDDIITIGYDLTEGIMGAYDVRFDNPDMAKMDVIAATPNDSTFEIPITDKITPNVYTAQLIMDNVGCDSVVENVVFTVNYPDTILAQRWNDVIGIRNTEYNGGYEFSSYQWYKGNDSILGATNPNLYVQGGLDLDAEYTVKVVRTTDNVELFVCPIALKDMSETDDKPTSVVFSEQTIKIAAKNRSIVKVWSVSGILISASDIAAGESEVTAPKDTGIYLLEIISTDGNRETHKIVVK